MRCKVCGGRSRTGEGFLKLFKAAEGYKIGGKPVFVHEDCRSKLEGSYIEADKPQDVIPKWIQRKLKIVVEKPKAAVGRITMNRRMRRQGKAI